MGSSATAKHRQYKVVTPFANGSAYRYEFLHHARYIYHSNHFKHKLSGNTEKQHETYHAHYIAVLHVISCPNNIIVHRFISVILVIFLYNNSSLQLYPTTMLLACSMLIVGLLFYVHCLN